MIFKYAFFLLCTIFPFDLNADSAIRNDAFAEKAIIIHHTSNQNKISMFESIRDKSTSIAIISSPKTIGKYSQSIYNVSLATLLSLKETDYRIKQFNIPDESQESIDHALKEIRSEGFNAILAPLTANGAKNLMATETYLPIFIPTVHKRDFPSSTENIVFGAIDYESQINALIPYMSDSIAIFYDNSYVGENLKSTTETLFLGSNSSKKTVSSYPVDIKGDKIISHLSRPSTFNKKSIIMHIPVVKSSVLAAHLTFTNVREKNILSTQINVDPTLLTLTQYNDRKNMILANSLIDFPDSIYQTNEMMGNDIAFDWVNYASSVGIDYLVSLLEHSPRSYGMRINNHQVIYPIMLVRAAEFGFEPYAR